MISVNTQVSNSGNKCIQRYLLKIWWGIHGKCIPEENYLEFHSNIVPWVDAVFYSYLPFIILFTFNVLIIWSFNKAHKRQKNLHGDRNARKS
jgi:hypothetical protein